MLDKQYTDIEILKCALQHFSKEIYDATLGNSGYQMSTEMCDTISRINLMLRAAELIRELNARNCSLTELACVRAKALRECPCESDNEE